MNPRPRLIVPFLLVLALACRRPEAGREGGDRAPAGSIAVALTLAPGANATAASYEITGDDITPITGTIALTDAGERISFVVSVPAGTGYTLRLSTTSSDGIVTCMASTRFAIIAGATTSVDLVLSCYAALDPASVLVTGTFNNCPLVTLRAAPLQAAVGQNLALEANATDLDPGSTLSYTWTASANNGAGDFLDPRTAHTSFRCLTPGTVTLRITASDGQCGRNKELRVTCIASSRADNLECSGRACVSTPTPAFLHTTRDVEWLRDCESPRPRPHWQAFLSKTATGTFLLPRPDGDPALARACADPSHPLREIVARYSLCRPASTQAEIDLVNRMEQWDALTVARFLNAGLRFRLGAAAGTLAPYAYPSEILDACAMAPAENSPALATICARELAQAQAGTTAQLSYDGPGAVELVARLNQLFGVPADESVGAAGPAPGPPWPSDPTNPDVTDEYFCNTCYYDRCFQSCGPPLSAARQVLYDALLACVRRTNCAATSNSVCWCGTASPPTCSSVPGAANGPCLAEEVAAAEVTDLSTISARYFDPRFASGAVHVRLACEHDFCPAVCPPR